MGFCILGGKENYLRKVLSDKLTALGHTIGVGSTPSQYAAKIQEVSDDQYEAGKSAYAVRRVSLNGQRGSDDTWTEFTFSVEANRTLWVDLFPTVTTERYWIWNGDPGLENTSGHTWTLSGTTLKCSCYRRRAMSADIYYIN